ncbi:MAG: acylphosphatase [Candidatus Daviesbacteria bacterium]|nr:acylphosphatase [Candidatus Daviesbacteria bacterium]
MKHLDIKVIGRVQGVFFRAFTKEEAETLELTGFVKNHDDGSVYISAEGEEDKLKQFIKWCHKGPMLAKVEKVEVSTGNLMNYDKFSIT